MHTHWQSNNVIIKLHELHSNMRHSSAEQSFTKFDQEVFLILDLTEPSLTLLKHTVLSTLF